MFPTRIHPPQDLDALLKGYWIVFVQRAHSGGPTAPLLESVIEDDGYGWSITRRFESDTAAKAAVAVLEREADVVRVMVVHVKGGIVHGAEGPAAQAPSPKKK